MPCCSSGILLHMWHTVAVQCDTVWPTILLGTKWHDKDCKVLNFSGFTQQCSDTGDHSVLIHAVIPGYTHVFTQHVSDVSWMSSMSDVQIPLDQVVCISVSYNTPPRVPQKKISLRTKTVGHRPMVITWTGTSVHSSPMCSRHLALAEL